MTLKDAGLDVAALTALHEAIGDALKGAKAATQDGLKASKKESGTKQITVDLPGSGKTVATITLVSPDPAAVITDEEAFLAWAIENCPSEIERRYVGVVTEVRPAFLKALLKEMTSAGAAKWCDKATGVIHDVPGVELQGRAQYQRLTFTKTGRDDLIAAWRAGQLAGSVLPELAPAPEDTQ